jgi:hypothetical protein
VWHLTTAATAGLQNRACCIHSLQFLQWMLELKLLQTTYHFAAPGRRHPLQKIAIMTGGGGLIIIMTGGGLQHHDGVL